MTIQVDSREKARAIKKIEAEFQKRNIKYYTSKLFVGDYMSLDNPRLIVDRKQNLSELCTNICYGHKRFTNELTRAKENGIKLVILCEHGHGIENIQDLVFWENPRSKKRIRVDGQWVTEEVIYTKEFTSKTGKKYTRQYHPTTGPELYQKLISMEDKYSCEFQFCTKADTGRRIVEILGENHDT